MTKFPINLVYDRHDGMMHEGFAATADAAIAKIAAERGDEWNVTSAELATCEVGAVTKNRADFESAWAKEIAAGYVHVIHVHGGFKGEATYWAVGETPRD